MEATNYGSELKAKADIEQGFIDDNVFEYKDLYKCVENGDWKRAESLIEENNGELPSASGSGRTVLHFATLAGHVNVVEGLVRVGGDILVKKKDHCGYTALALAAHLTGNNDVAKCMVEKKDGGVREDLLGLGIPIENEAGTSTEIPLLLAADKGHKQMTRYLYHKTPSDTLNELGSSRNRVLLLERCIKAEIFDVALEILESDAGQLPPESLLSDGFGALQALAQMPSVFLSGCQFGLPERIIYHILREEKKFLNSGEGSQKTNFSGRLLLETPYVFVRMFKFLNIFGIREIYEKKCTHYQVKQILRCLTHSVAGLNNSQLNKASVYDAMLHAAKHGTVEFINAMREANHELLWALDGHNRGVFSHAVLNRKQNVFRLIHTLNGRKDIIKSRKDVFGNNLLHLAGHLGPSSELNRTAGAALQMQREIQWFKAVEKIVHPTCQEEKNADHKKPHELFTETHKELVKDGEKWAKDTATSCIVVGTFVATIMFAGAFTIPGGNNQDTGAPIFSNTKAFTVFIVADAISILTSATSVLIFIAIITSRFAERDFLKQLPLKLVLGFVFLFLSVVSMMVAFCAALAIVLNEYRDYRQLFIGATIYGSIPVVVLLISQLSFIYEIFRSTRSNPIGHIKKKKQ